MSSSLRWPKRVAKQFTKRLARVMSITAAAVLVLGSTAGPSRATIESTLPAVTISREPVPREYFGMHIHRLGSTTTWPVVSFGSWRLWDAGVAWPWLEPTHGDWRFEKLDAYVELAQDHGVDILLPLGLSPTWTSTRPDEPSGYQKGFAAPPRDLGQWREYVRTVATRYKGRIHNYELWNEPNLKQFYSGSVGEMVALAREAYSTLKQVDPTIVLVSPAPVNEPGLQWLDEYLASGGSQYLDVVGYHFYEISSTPESMLPLIGRVRDIMTKHGLEGRPLWNTETGWIGATSPGSVNPQTVGFGPEATVLTQDAAAAYLARALILGWTAGLGRFYWYSWDHLATGLIDPDGTLRPAGRSYAEVERWLVGRDLACPPPDREGTWVCRVSNAQGYQGIVAWNPQVTVDLSVPNDWRSPSVRAVTGPVTTVARGARIAVGNSPVLVEPSGAPH